MVRQINELEEFKKILKESGDKLVVVDFFADWCGPCRAMAPKFEEASKNPKYENVIFLKVNVTEAEEIGKACEIKSIPTFHFYKNGEKVDHLSGMQPEVLLLKLDANKT